MYKLTQVKADVVVFKVETVLGQ